MYNLSWFLLWAHTTTMKQTDFRRSQSLFKSRHCSLQLARPSSAASSLFYRSIFVLPSSKFVSFVWMPWLELVVLRPRHDSFVFFEYISSPLISALSNNFTCFFMLDTSVSRAARGNVLFFTILREPYLTNIPHGLSSCWRCEKRAFFSHLRAPFPQISTFMNT